MKSIILRTATRLLFAVLLMFSVFLFLRGHNFPGGGFIGGLVAAMAFILLAFSESVQKAREMLMIDPYVLAGIGLAVASLTGVVPFIAEKPFLTGLWWEPKIGGAHYHFGTPLVFDLGVYFVVVGFLLKLMLGLLDEYEKALFNS